MKNQETVFVGLSGGVDSSVAALRLKRAGYKVVGVFIKVWHPEFMVCNWEAERLDAMRVAAHLDIPFLTCDAEVTYRDHVAHYFIEEYKAGRTPNPDILCNKEVKFGAFLQFAKEKGADYIATGHYTQRIDGRDGAQLHRGLDANKDQSYFLWSLTPEQITQALFPIGDTSKEEIRAEAAAASIPTATKKDSQGICFLGHVDIPEFLSHYTHLVPGPVLSEAGEVIGEHKGALVYTLGQRHGFNLNTHDPERTHHYVVQKDLAANTITVAPHPPELPSTHTTTLQNIVMRTTVAVGDTLEAQFRYRQKPFSIMIESISDKTLQLRVHGEVEMPAAGQSCVIYRDTLCLGGGIIA